MVVKSKSGAKMMGPSALQALAHCATRGPTVNTGQGDLRSTASALEPEAQALESGQSVGAEHGEIDALRLNEVEDRGRSDPVGQDGFAGHAGLLGLLAQLIETISALFA